MAIVDDVKSEFSRRYGEDPALVVRAPGRVNLIGGHTDYNEGYVLPLTINRATYIALRPREDGHVTVHSMSFDESRTFDVTSMVRGDEGWFVDVKCGAWSLSESDYALRGWEGVVGGDVPLGAGLSSSASLELAVARAFAAVSGFYWDAVAMAKIAQRAEYEWVGMRCGILDQLIVSVGEEGSALLIDCRSLELTPTPIPEDIAVVILDTGTRHKLVGSEYNKRREQSQEAANHFKVNSLRDISPSRFEKDSEDLDEVLLKRARHIISENGRVILAAEMMKNSAMTTVGRLMLDSHVSLRDDYEVSGPGLNAMWEIAKEQDGCYGARMTGGGFGGSVVALVRDFQAQTFARNVKAEYDKQTGNTSETYICVPTNGAEVIE